jgi:hypothetical protein
MEVIIPAILTTLFCQYIYARRINLSLKEFYSFVLCGEDDYNSLIALFSSCIIFALSSIVYTIIYILIR